MAVYYCAGALGLGPRPRLATHGRVTHSHGWSRPFVLSRYSWTNSVDRAEPGEERRQIAPLSRCAGETGKATAARIVTKPRSGIAGLGAHKPLCVGL